LWALRVPLEHLGTRVFPDMFSLSAAQGFEVVPVPAGETRKPRRDIPIGVVTSLLAASALYVVVQAVLVGAYPHIGEVSDTPLADAAIAVVPALGTVVAVGGLISTLGFVSGAALGTPRYLYAAAVDRHLPQALSGLHARYESPHVAIIATSAISAALALGFDYRALIGMSNVAVAVQYLGTCLAVLVLRRRPARPTGFRVPFGPVIPLVGAAVSAWVFTEASSEELLWAAGSMAVGVVLVAVTRRALATKV